MIIYNFSTLVLLRRKNASEILNYSNTPAGGFINLLVSSLYRKNGSADRGNLIHCNIYNQLSRKLLSRLFALLSLFF